MWPNVHATASPRVASQVVVANDLVERPDDGMFSPPDPGAGVASPPGAGLGSIEGLVGGAGVASVPLALQQVDTKNGAAISQVEEFKRVVKSEHEKEKSITVAIASGLTKGPSQISQEYVVLLFCSEHV